RSLTGYRLLPACTSIAAEFLRIQLPSAGALVRGGRPAGCQLFMEPGAGVSPVTVGGCDRNPQGLGCLRNREPAEIPEFDQLRLGRIDPLEPLQRFIDGQQLVVRSRGGCFEPFEGTPLGLASAPLTVAPPGAVDQHAAHCFRSRGEEMAAAVPVLD